MTGEPIQRGDTVRFNEAFKTLVEGDGKKFRYGLHTDDHYQQGEVLEVRGDIAVVDWNDVSLPREMKFEHLEKVEQKPVIAVGETVRLTETAYRAQTPSIAFKNGEVLELSDGRAVIDWLDQALPREVDVSDLEKVVRKKPTAGWSNKTAGIDVGDTVQYSRTRLQSTSTFTGDLPRAKGKVTAIKDLGGLQIATIDWDKPDLPERVNVANLSKVKVRGVADE